MRQNELARREEAQRRIDSMKEAAKAQSPQVDGLDDVEAALLRAQRDLEGQIKAYGATDGLLGRLYGLALALEVLKKARA